MRWGGDREALNRGRKAQGRREGNKGCRIVTPRREESLER